MRSGFTKQFVDPKSRAGRLNVLEIPIFPDSAVHGTFSSRVATIERKKKK